MNVFKKAKHKELEILKGDGKNQYTLLLDYIDELSRVCLETTCKIQVN